jgi:hypothetical protein
MSCRKKLIKGKQFLCGLLFCLSTEAQPAHLPSENGYTTAGANSIHFMDAFSFRSNPACLGGIKDLVTGMLFERKWMLPELDNVQLAVSSPLEKGGLGISIQHSGDADYSELAAELGYGKNLGKVDIGVCFHYLQDQAAGYQAVGYGSSSVGIRFHVSDKFISGWEIGLPVFGQAGTIAPERAPQFYRMGFGYEYNPDLFLSVQVEKTAGLPLNTICSVEYRYSEQFFFSFSINSLAESVFFKSGWKKNRICVQVFTLFEPVLGLSSGIVLLWRRKNKME